MKFFDFFAGIGGFRLGMEMAGHECVGHCEIDKYANISYTAMHNPKESEVYFDDIRTVKPSDMPECDCYCFGFPCQAFSIASIVNWGKYQFCDDKTDQQIDQQEATQPTNNRPTDDHTQEIKNIRNKEIYKDVPEDILPAFLEWAQMRTQMKRPLVSERAVKMAINKLNKLANTTEKKIEIIEYAIYRNWLSFYEIPKEDRKKTINYYHEEEREIEDPADEEYVQAIKDKIAGFVKGVE